MSFEKPPTIETPESELESSPEEEKIESKKAPGETPEEKAEKEHVDDTVVYFGPSSQVFFRDMSDGAKKLASKVYEGLYKTPGVKRIVGKLEIAYNQFWIDRHEEKAVELKNEINSLDSRVGALGISKSEIESRIDDLKQQNLPGAESLQSKLKDMDRQRIELLNKKDKTQSKFELKESKAKLYAGERDRVADKLIDRYGEKLEPLEGELGDLLTSRDQLDLSASVAVVRHKEQMAKLDKAQETKEQIEQTLRGTGMSEKEIKGFSAVRELEDMLAQGRESIRVEIEKLIQEKAKINSKIARVDGRANIYRNKKEEFIRIKERKPLKTDEAKAQIREQKPDTTETSKKDIKETRVEIAEENKERLEISSLVSGWNTHLQEKYGDKAHDKLVENGRAS